MTSLDTHAPDDNASAIRARSIAAGADLFEIIRRRRGWNATLLHEIGSISSEPLAGIDEAARYLRVCIVEHRPITIITDFDMDGICAGTIMYAGLKELGAEVNITIPDYRGPREMTSGEVNDALTRYPDTRLIITCDGGINSNAGIEYAQNILGVDVMVTDHHVELSPGCSARFVCNPNTINSTYPHPEICGAQVAHMLLSHYTRTFDRAKLQAIMRLEVFAGIGALTDVMPLTHATRELVRRACGWLTLCVPDIPENHWGSFDPLKAHAAELNSATALDIIERGNHHPAYVAAFEGLSLMMRELAAVKKLTSPENINVSFIGFTIGPMFNATRRIGGNMEDTFAVFMPDVVAKYYPHSRIDRAASMRQVISNNELRKQLTKDAMEEMANTEQPYAPYVFFADAPGGIMGLLAANMMKLTGLPTVVLNPHTFSGSARAPLGVPVIDIAAWAAAKHNMTQLVAIGHQQACGFKAGGTGSITAYIEVLEAFLDQMPTDNQQAIHADLWLVDAGERELPEHYDDSATRQSGYAFALEHADAAIDDLDALLYLHERLEAMAPYGAGFSYPLIDVTARVASCEITTMGSNKQHMKIITPSGFTFLWWNQAQELDTLKSAESFTATVELGQNTFRGTTTPQGVVNHMTMHAHPKAQAA